MNTPFRFQTLFSLLFICILQRKCAYAQQCLLCGSQNQVLQKPNEIALQDGTTCAQLGILAESHSETDAVCALYQIIGFNSCGCPPPIESEAPHCTLCPDGGAPILDAVYDRDENIKCSQVQEYLQRGPQSDESCDAIQYTGVLNCGCSPPSVDNPVCNLCKNPDDRVTNPDTIVAGTSHGSTCGLIEFVLATDVEKMYDETSCIKLQKYFSPRCLCTVIPDTSSPSAKPSIARSTAPSRSPRASYSNSPSNSPSLQGSNAPSVSKSTVPSDSPSWIPSTLSSVFPSWAPSAIPSTAPSLTSSTEPSTTMSVAPSLHHSNEPSSSPSLIPSTEPSLATSGAPSLHHSNEPSFSRSWTPSTEPSLAMSETPSLHHSNEPSYSYSPSFSPSSITDKKPNCTALGEGIMPKVGGLVEKTTYNLIFDLLFQMDPGWELSSDFTQQINDLKQLFDIEISVHAAGCVDEQSITIDQKVHYVNMNDISQITDFGCNPTTILKGEAFDVICVPWKSTVEIYFSPQSSFQMRRSLATNSDVLEFVAGIVQDQFSSLAQKIVGVYGGTVGKGSDDIDQIVLRSPQSLSMGSQAAIGVGVGCSLVAVIAVGIIIRGRKKEQPPEMSGIITGGLRSDDSISDNPTISSGRRPMLAGWDGSVNSDSFQDDTHSEASSSRKSSMMKLDDASKGTERRVSSSHMSEDVSYLPSSVLRDLLGNENDDNMAFATEANGTFATHTPLINSRNAGERSLQDYLRSRNNSPRSHYSHVNRNLDGDLSLATDGDSLFNGESSVISGIYTRNDGELSVNAEPSVISGLHACHDEDLSMDGNEILNGELSVISGLHARNVGDISLGTHVDDDLSIDDHTIATFNTYIRRRQKDKAVSNTIEI